MLAVRGATARILFSTVHPGPLVEGLQAQRRWPVIAAFLRAYDVSLARNRGHWDFSLPAVSPHGQAVYFAANLGKGHQQSRNNSTFLVFKANTRDGKLIDLEKFGGQYGKAPTLRVSPDGRRLLVVQAESPSAPQQPVRVTTLDPVTQTGRELTATDLRREEMHSLNGFCWLADGRHVAYSVEYHRSEDALRGGPTAEPQN